MNGPRMSGLLRVASLPQEFQNTLEVAAQVRQAGTELPPSCPWSWAAFAGAELSSSPSPGCVQARNDFAKLTTGISSACGLDVSDEISLAQVKQLSAQSVASFLPPVPNSARDAARPLRRGFELPADCPDEQFERLNQISEKLAIWFMQNRGLARMDIFLTSLNAAHFASKDTAAQAVSTGAAAAERALAASALSPWVYSVAAARKVGASRGDWEQSSAVADAFAEIGVRGASRRSREAQAHAAVARSQGDAKPHPDSSEMWLLEALQTRAASLVASSDAITIALRIQDELHSTADEGVLQAPARRS